MPHASASAAVPITLRSSVTSARPARTAASRSSSCRPLGQSGTMSTCTSIAASSARAFLPTR